jgi:hypothetical protein
VPNPRIETCVDPFTSATINTVLWSTITGGAASLDTVNDQVLLAVPTASGGINTFGTTTLFDATGSALYAQVGVAANGNGGTKSIMRLRLDANNAMTMRVESGIFRQVQVSGGTTTTVTLPAYDPHAHRWWRLREVGGVFFADASPDGLNWTNLGSMAYTWDATQVTVRFESQASVTEVAGNATVIAHVNTRLGGQANPSWPYMEYGLGLSWGANGGAIPLDVYVDVSTRTQDQTTVSRGRQYELDQVRSGEENETLSNTDGVLDPTSSTSPFAGRMQPFQPTRIRAQWPPTVNLLSQGIATGGDVGGATVGTITASTILDLLSDTDTTGGSIATSATAWAGGRVAQFAVLTGASVAQRIAHTAQVAVLPGGQYTAQFRVRNVTASTSLQVKPFVGWPTTAGTATPTSYTYGSTVTLTGSATAGWTTVTVTGTAPAGTYGIDVGIAVAATAAATCSVQFDGGQLEKGSIASAWVCPGAWYPMFAGFTEDVPSQWNMSGTYGVVSPPAADAFSLLSQLTLADPLTQEFNSHGLRFLYTLADPEGSTSFTDQTGAFPAITATASKYGPGIVTAGAAITAAAASGVYTGATGSVVTINNGLPGINTKNPASFLNLNSAGIVGPSSTTFTRMIAFRYAPATNPGVEVDIWSAIDNNHGQIPGSQIRLYIDSSGHLNFNMSSFANTGGAMTGTTNVADGNWHLALFGEDAIGGASTTNFLSVDGSFTSGDASGGGGHGTPWFPTGIVTDCVGAFVDGTLGNTTTFSFSGDVSYVAELTSALTATDCANLYSAWRSAAAGESSAARYARILRYAGYTGPSSIATGLTTSMGPADTAGQDVVSALQSVVDTENGAHFVARDGTITFLGRNARYNATVPSVTFGENAAGGEWPYEDVQTVWDSTHLGNKIQVTQSGTGQVFYAQDAASIAAYFPRTLTRSVNTTSSLEAQDAADYLLSRYKQPLSRISSLALHPAAMPALWPTVLGLELSTRARVMRRPPNLPATQIECFVENVSWSWDNTANATVTLQCSPADTTLYAIFAAWHTTLNGSPASGVSTITVNASQDTTNPLATQLAAGQQLVLGQNTANQETVTISTVGASSTGWTTCTIALAAPTTKPHTGGDIVCEPLPAGVTDPTTFDAASAFDATVFAY